MKKFLNGFDYARRYVDGQITEASHELPEFELPDDKEVSSIDSLLKVVYAPSPLTGLPSGDLAYLVSDKANPQIKQFILDNLMMDVSMAASPSVPANIDLSEDDLFALTRQRGESIEDYANRLNTSISRDKWIVSQAKESVKDSVKELVSD